MKLEVGKCYKTRTGIKVRVICTDADRPHYPVIALAKLGINDYAEPTAYTEEGRHYVTMSGHVNDIIGPWTDLKEGQLVFVGDPKHMTLVRRFVSMNDDGSHNVLADFDKPEVWNNCRAITPEDLVCPP